MFNKKERTCPITTGTNQGGGGSRGCWVGQGAGSGHIFGLFNYVNYSTDPPPPLDTRMHYIDHLNKGNLLQRVTYSDVMNVKSTRNIRFNSLPEVVLPLKHLNRCTHCYCHILSFIRTLYLTNYIIYFRSFWNWLIYKKHLIKRKCFF